MALKHLVNNKTSILLQDKLGNEAHQLLLHLLRTYTASRQTYVFHTDGTSADYKLTNNLTFIDLYSDPLGWKSSNSGKMKDIWTDLAKIKTEESVLVIDSLSTILNHHSLETVYTQLSQLTKDQSKFFTVIFVLHSDLHDEFTKQTISEVVDCIIKLSPTPSVISTPLDGAFIVLQKRPSGKVVQTKEFYTISSDYTALNILSAKQVEKFTKEEPQEVVIQKSTFNLSLTKEELKAKNEVVLPYMNVISSSPSTTATTTPEGAGSVIFVSNDDVDDFDSEEDLDDDVDI